MLAQVRKEYEMLRIEFEQQLAANEQTGPINREMRHLITSLQNHNLQLKGEIGRYKRKYREVAVDLSKVCGFLCFFPGILDRFTSFTWRINLLYGLIYELYLYKYKLY